MLQFLKKFSLREDFSRPHKRTAENFAKQTFLRTVEVDQIKQFILNSRVSNQKATTARQPILATFAIPGSGKTHFMDEIMYLNTDENFKKSLAKLNKTFFPIYVTLSSWSPLTEYEIKIGKDREIEYKSSPILWICSRILFK
jgi:hypothetical protein